LSRREKACELRRQTVLVLARGKELVEARKLFGLTGIQGLEAHRPARQRPDPAARKHADREVDGNSAGMEKVQRPYVHGPTGQVRTARRMGNDPLVSVLKVSGQEDYSSV
jgi:hypothetical protein